MLLFCAHADILLILHINLGILCSNMKIKSFLIENFKSVESIEISLDPNLNVLTGVNNSGKTTIIEAIALWAECFEKLLGQAKRAVKDKNIAAGDFMLGSSSNRFFDFDSINSIRCPNYEDIFRDCDTKRKIVLSAKIDCNGAGDITIPFNITSSTNTRYAIRLENEKDFDVKRFNALFQHLPTPVSTYFSAPVANIEQKENFVTEPMLNDKIRQRRSFEIVRNRLYRLYHTNYFQQFQSDLSYVLYGTTSAKIKFISRSDVNHDIRVLLNYTIDRETAEKDLALLGSGSLQAIEILLNLYNEVNEKHDINLILLDEPDSHIHRSIQTRLFDILNRYANQNQIVMTTHNESMIRTTPLHNLFHIDNAEGGKVVCVRQTDLKKLHERHFAGLYPSQLKPIIGSLNGATTGLDFISAIEAEKIIFVEGDDDARLLYRLFNQNPLNVNRKVMFWVLGGVSQMMDKIDAYYYVFKDIRNGQSLWSKSVLVFDKDRMCDDHCQLLCEKLTGKYGIPVHVADLYTQESVLLTDTKKLAALLGALFGISQLDELDRNLITECEKKRLQKIEHYTNEADSQARVKAYIGMYLDKMNKHYDACIRTEEIPLLLKLNAYYRTQPVWKFATKDDVAEVINNSMSSMGLTHFYDLETDFYRLVQIADTQTLFAEWEKAIAFLSDRR